MPAIEHLNHSPDCAWAINVCISYRSDDPDRVEEDPMEDKYVEARKATFQDSWPHETKKGWKCKVKKVARSTPTTEAGCSLNVSFRWSRPGGATTPAPSTTTA